jgi:predicted esterase
LSLRLSLVAALVVLGANSVGAAQAYLREPAEIRVVGEVAEGETVPVVVFLPATGGTSEWLFDTTAHLMPIDAFVAVLPQGRPRRSDYLPRFGAFIDAFQERLLPDVERAITNFPGDRDAVHLMGFSLGGDLAWALLMRHPEVFVAGLMMGARCSHRVPRATIETLRARGGRTVFAMGESDSAVRVRGIERSYERMQDAQIPASLSRYPGAHRAPPEDIMRELLGALLLQQD